MYDANSYRRSSLEGRFNVPLIFPSDGGLLEQLTLVFFLICFVHYCSIALRKASCILQCVRMGMILSTLHVCVSI